MPQRCRDQRRWRQKQRDDTPAEAELLQGFTAVAEAKIGRPELRRDMSSGVVPDLSGRLYPHIAVVVGRVNSGHGDGFWASVNCRSRR